MPPSAPRRRPSTIRLWGPRASGLVAGQPVDDSHYDVLVTGDADVWKPDGTRLACVRRGVVSPENRDPARLALRTLRGQLSLNRGIAAGAPRQRKLRKSGVVSNTAEAMPVPSAIIGYFDRYPRIPYCRQTAWNADNPERFAALAPMFAELAACFKAAAPERFEKQMETVRKTSPDFVIAGTPWTTVTVNSNWATCLHTDKGDLPSGFSCLTVLRSGRYRGGILVFPAFRVGVELFDGDMIMMDSHEWHANTPFVETSDDFERISCVLYYREKMTECGSASDELARAKNLRNDLLDEAPDEPADG